MSAYLCISVRILDNLFHGRGGYGNQPEWPPSPLRLFQALVAGATAGRHQQSWEDKKHAFEWLERQPPPEIITPKAVRALAYKAFVPNNDGDKQPNRQDRLTSKLHLPHRILEDSAIHYLWKLSSEQDKTSANTIAAEAKKLLALGWGIDMAIGHGQILDEESALALEGERWRPQRIRGTNHKLRAPQSGTLENLLRTHASKLASLRKGGIYTPPIPLSNYQEFVYLRSGEIPPRPYAAFALEQIDRTTSSTRWRAFDHTYVAKVAAMLRHLTLETAQLDRHTFEGGIEKYVAGHITTPEEESIRFSYLPLPSVGHPNSRGMIRRVLIAEPHGGSGDHATWASQRLIGRVVKESEMGKPRAVAVLGMLDEDDRRMVCRYTNKSRSWVSVTPVILPGHDDGKYEKAIKLLVKAFRQAGLNAEIEDLFLCKSPLVAGSSHVSSYFRPSHLTNKPAWHVRVIFRSHVGGPLAIGAGRHVGLGLFVPADT